MPELPPLLPTLDDPRALAEACLGAAPPAEGVLEAVDLLGVPRDELTPTAISLRIAAAAAAEGRAFVHHELRHPLPVAPELLPEIDVGDLDVGWTAGVLQAPKYFSAFLDAPLPTYDPNHRTKWRAHELLHRLARFVWRPDIARFEAYLGSRLSELLPVVHWYGLDEIGRGKCAAHRGVVLHRDTCEACEAEARPYWEVAPDRASALVHAEHALEHLATELDACSAERTTGQRHATPRPGLDASEDAIGYLRGHWNRITAWSFGAWVELFLRPGVDYFESTADMLAHVRGLLPRVLCEPIAIDPAAAARARTRRFTQDVGYRILRVIETLDDDAEAELRPVLEALAEHDDPEPALHELDERLRLALAGGWTWRPAPEPSIDLVMDGLRSGLPRSLEARDDAWLRAQVKRFVASPAFAGRGELFVRFAAFVDDDAIAFEAWLRARPSVDLEAERFAAIPDGTPEAGTLRCNATLRTGTFSANALRTVLDWSDDEIADDVVELVAVHWGGEPRAFVLDAEPRRVLEAARQGRWAGDADTRAALLLCGTLVWLPRPR